MRHTRQRRQGVFPWITRTQSLIMFCCMLVVPGGGAGVAQANQLYTATVPFFSDDFGTGTGDQPPTVLMVVYGEADVIEQRLKPAVANLNDFSRYPEGELQLSPEVGTGGISLLVPEGATDAVVTDADAVDVEDLSGLAFDPIEGGASLMMQPGDLLFFSMGLTEIHTIQPMVSASGIVLAFEVESLGTDEAAIPEPSSLLLVGIGLPGVLGLGRRRRGTRT